MTTKYIDLARQIRLLAEKANRNPDEIRLIAVVKNLSLEEIRALYDQGGRHFAENRTANYLSKRESLPTDCRWHFIGPLQTKKINRFLPQEGLIHSVHHPDLARKINEACKRGERVQRILLQVNTSGEPSKQGLSPADWRTRLDELNQLLFLQVEGLMTMAPLTNDTDSIRACFRDLASLVREWRPLMREPEKFKELSMGMSHDYPLAIEEGATYLRIGSALQT